jgi:uncharacterized protein (TIGR00369 family)
MCPTGEASDAQDPDELMARFGKVFLGAVPHNAALGIELLDFDRRGSAVMRLPYAEHLVGHPETGVLHGGAITSLVDATCGAAVFGRLDPPRPIATLDLRIDYLGPAQPPRDVVCRAQCTKVTRHVAFVTATAYHDDERKPIASAAATFMVFRSMRRQRLGPESEGGT